MFDFILFVGFMLAYSIITGWMERKEWDELYERRLCNKRNRLKERRKA